jgi:uncharacterized repeat protein (TIGR01451 family)
MGGLFSTISGQFTKPIILGSLFPAAIFLAAGYFFVLPMAPWEMHDAARFAALEAQWKIVALTVTAMVLAFLLYVLNRSIIRLYEGYPWKDGKIGTALVKRHQKKLAEAIAQRAEIHPLRLRYMAEVKAAEKKAKAIEEAKAKVATEEEKSKAKTGEEKAKAAIAEEKAKVVTLESREREMIKLQWIYYPKLSSVLPTRLGNIIRSFENYAERQYGFSAIAFWPRFAAKIDAPYAIALDDAKSSFDFVINLSFLSAVLFIVILLLGLAFPAPWMISRALCAQWLAKLVVLAAASWLFYTAAAGSAQEWGDLVRGAFDLYRRPVLQSLGFTEVPSDLHAERALWAEISRQISWGDRFEADAPAVRFQSGSLELLPANPALVLTRGVAAAATPKVRKIVVSVENTGTTEIAGVRFTDTLAAERQLVWSSARLDGAAVKVTGTNPYTFAIGVVGGKSTRELSYEVAGA